VHDLEHGSAFDMLYMVVQDFITRGNLGAAERALTHALKQSEDVGRLDSRLLELLDDVATRHCLRRDYAEAERLYWIGLETRERVLGSNHPLISESLRKLEVILRHTRGKEAAMFLAFRAMSLSHSAVTA